MRRRSLSTAGLVSPAFGESARNGASKTRNVPKFLTIEQVAERLEVSSRTVRRWIAADLLAAYRLGGVVRIAEPDFLAFLAQAD